MCDQVSRRRPLASIALIGLLLLVLAQTGGCAASALERPHGASHAFLGGEDTPLGRIAGQRTAAAAPGESSIELLPGGLESLAARLALIDRARHTVDLQYYIFRDDGSGRGVAEALWRAAERGVRVRMLLDDWGSRPPDGTLSRFASHPGIEVRLFNPLRLRWPAILAILIDFDRANRRMHNKALVADNQAAIVGGRNVGDEYFQRRTELDFGDLDVLAFGPVVAQVSRGFDQYWNSGEAAAVRPGAGEGGATGWAAGDASSDALRSTEFEARLDEAPEAGFIARAVALHDPPAKAAAAPAPDGAPAGLGRMIASAIGEAESTVLIVTPYFVPGAGGIEQFRALRDRGVQVRIVTNSLAATDVVAVHAGYAKYRRRLLEMGVELFEIRADATAGRRKGSGGARGSGTRGSGSALARMSLHAKVMVVDGRAAFIGSMNVDPRSIRLNTENGIVVHSERLAQALQAGVDADLASDAWRVELRDGALRWASLDAGAAVRREVEPDAGAWLRTKAKLLSLLPLEGLL